MQTNLTEYSARNYLMTKEHIASRSPKPDADLYFSIQGNNLGEISVNIYNGGLFVNVPLHTSYSNLKEDIGIVKRLADIYKVELVEYKLNEKYKRYVLKKKIVSQEDVDNIYNLAVKIKLARAEANDSFHLNKSLENLLAQSCSKR